MPRRKSDDRRRGDEQAKIVGDLISLRERFHKRLESKYAEILDCMINEIQQKRIGADRRKSSRRTKETE